MQLAIEQWLASQPLTRDASDLFRESVICYKAGAYRAALLLGYLGFQSTVRDRILTAAAPTGFPPGQWTSIQNDLRNDDKWDPATFDATQNKSNPIFTIADDIRKQVAYWKDRRNDCAHSKANAISAAHVESFWLFAQSNLPKMVVTGSSQALLARIERHFDPTYVMPGTDPLPLATEVASAVDRRYLTQFFDELLAAMSTPSLFGTTPVLRQEVLLFFEALFRQPDTGLQASTLAYLTTNEPLLVAVLRYAPSRVTYLNGQPQLIRRLWTTYLFNGWADFPTYAALLRNNLIPATEVADAHVQIIDRMKGGVPDDSDAAALEASDFIAAFDQYAFDEGSIDRFDWGNPNSGAVRWRLERYPLTDSAVSKICSKFDAEPCAHGPRDALTQLFAQNSAEG